MAVWWSVSLACARAWESFLSGEEKKKHDLEKTELQAAYTKKEPKLFHKLSQNIISTTVGLILTSFLYTMLNYQPVATSFGRRCASRTIHCLWAGSLSLPCPEAVSVLKDHNAPKCLCPTCLLIYLIRGSG